MRAGAKTQKVRATAYVFLATDCPIAGRYGPRLAKLAQTYRARGVRFVLVFPNSRESAAGVKKWVADRKLSTLTEVRRDPKLAWEWNATTSPQVVLTNAKNECRYRGRLDDADDPAKVTRRDLALALDATLAGKRPAVVQTKPFGCELSLPLQAFDEDGSLPGVPTATRSSVPYAEVAAVLQKHCVACHRAGEVGPMPLDDPATVFGFAKKIKEQTQSLKMPPWKADSSGEFHDEHRLTDAEKATLARWGERPSPPSPRRVPSGWGAKVEERNARGTSETWHLGKPDALFSMPEYDVPAEGKDIYRCFSIPTGNPGEDRWVKGLEIHPGNRAIVHHASVFLDTSGVGKRMDEASPGPGYTNPTPGNGPGFKEYFSVLGGWTPGHQPRKLPYGVAIFVPKGAELVLEVHYHLTGKPEKDKTQFGLYFASEPIDKKMYMGGVGSQTFTIPAGAKGFPVVAEEIAPADITLLSVTPHMHERGTRMTAYAELPSGERRKLIDVPRWDFQWQPSYRFKEPVRLPKGTKITVTGTFDNPTSSDLHWGESTKDEMCVMFLAFTRDDEHLLDEPVVIR